MQTKHPHISKMSLTGFEFILFFLILCGAAIQVTLGQHHVFFLFLRLIYAPGMVFLAGLYASQGDDNILLLLKHAAVYTVLFLFFGLCNQVLLNRENPFESIIRMVTMQKIPMTSEMFFTASVLFLCSALTARYIERLYKRKYLWIISGILASFISFFPSDIFGYPIIGVFIDCNVYDCIALLPYLGYFIAGIFLGKASGAFSRNLFIGSFVITFAAVALVFTPLKPAALTIAAVLPVSVIYLFSIYCPPYRKMTEKILMLYNRIVLILKDWYRDFMTSNRRALPLYFAVYTMMFTVMAVCVFFSFIEYGNSIA